MGAASKAEAGNGRNRAALALLAGTLAGCAITAAAFIACAALLTYTGLAERSVPAIVTVVCVLSSAVAGFDAARGARGRGWLWGLAAGLVYSAVLICAGRALAEGFSFDGRTLALIAVCVAGGGVGGVVGINTVSKWKQR